jgi:hypothetical protein
MQIARMADDCGTAFFCGCDMFARDRRTGLRVMAALGRSHARRWRFEKYRDDVYPAVTLPCGMAGMRGARASKRQGLTAGADASFRASFR